ncbi:hypothetical protein [Mesorhizobium sp. M0898]|uniref:hypothetical protein n=1 Tax=Mesorhizobium sp. M0898 TaxID=2957020 RepID=UPI00333A0A58
MSTATWASNDSGATFGSWAASARHWASAATEMGCRLAGIRIANRQDDRTQLGKAFFERHTLVDVFRRLLASYGPGHWQYSVEAQLLLSSDGPGDGSLIILRSCDLVPVRSMVREQLADVTGGIGAPGTQHQLRGAGPYLILLPLFRRAVGAGFKIPNLGVYRLVRNGSHVENRAADISRYVEGLETLAAIFGAVHGSEVFGTRCLARIAAGIGNGSRRVLQGDVDVRARIDQACHSRYLRLLAEILNRVR